MVVMDVSNSGNGCGRMKSFCCLLQCRRREIVSVRVNKSKERDSCVISLLVGKASRKRKRTRYGGDKKKVIGEERWRRKNRKNSFFKTRKKRIETKWY